jgi:hypothetical protein
MARLVGSRIFRDSAKSDVSPCLMAQVCTERAAALDRLERAVAARTAELIWLGIRPT